MKKIILLMPKINGYDEKIIKSLQENNFEVECLDYTEKYNDFRRKISILSRFYNNFFYKPIFKKSLRDKIANKKMENLFKQKKYDGDILLKISGIRIEEKILEVLKKKYLIMISHHLDSIGGFYSEENFLIEKKYFSKISTYDKFDAIKYKIKYLPNFYIKISNKKIICNQDIYTIMSDESRFNFLERIAKELKKSNVIYKFILVLKKKDQLTSNLIFLQNNFIPIDDMFQEFLKSKVILEIQRPENNGYTFRTFDCIGMKKKLITNNKEIINEDFYNPNNILVIDEDNIDIPKEFIDSPYEELPKEIYEKYSLENWIKQLLEIR